MSYESWRATFQNSEQAAKSAYKDAAKWFQKFNQADQENTELKAKLSVKNEAIVDAVKAARKSWAKSGNPLPVLEETLRQFDLFSLQKINEETGIYLLTCHVSGLGEFENTGELDKILADAIQTTMDGES